MTNRYPPPATPAVDPPAEIAHVWLTPEGLAQRLGIPVRTIRNWRESAVNKGPQGTRFGKHIRYRLVDVEEWEAAEEKEGRTRPGRHRKVPS